MSNVIDLVSPERVDHAWESYRVLAARLRNAPELLLDRKFNEEMARAHERWRKLFMAMESQ